ncbi:hypothetical protein SUDANB120_05984 [Streptomyces sp. enrichment culture]|uniref:hypothetical protein n=1 Tax=Streptomyces TaxID=1883 RepID=UPI0016790906|nr:MULTISPECIES: hypothetical protein [Streptomyces]MBD3577634.1 hypothetical protein [Streptomyces sp. KD18]
MDFFDGEAGGRDEPAAGAGGGCSGVTAVLLGTAVALAAGVAALFDLVRDLVP